MTQGEAIKNARERLRLTQAHLAGSAGVGRATVQRAEGDRPVSAECLRALCSVLGIDVASLPPPRPAKPPVPVAARPTPTGRPEGLAHDLGSAAASLCVGLLATFALLAWYGVQREPDLGRFVTDTVGVFLATGLACCANLCRAIHRRLAHPGMAVAAPRLPRSPGEVARLLRWSVVGTPHPGATVAAASAVPLLFATLFALHLAPWSYPSVTTMTWGGRNSTLAYRDAPVTVPTWSVAPGSPLDRAGLRPGDRLLSVAGTPIVDRFDAILALAATPAREVELDVGRPEIVAGDVDARETQVRLKVATEVDGSCLARSGIDADRALCGRLPDIAPLFATNGGDLRIDLGLRRFAGELMDVATMLLDPAKASDGNSATRRGTVADARLWASLVTFGEVLIPGIAYLAAALALVVVGLHARRPTPA